LIAPSITVAATTDNPAQAGEWIGLVT